MIYLGWIGKVVWQAWQMSDGAEKGVFWAGEIQVRNCQSWSRGKAVFYFNRTATI